jgi:versiconal hemiacetal acetate esterase
MEQLYTIGTSAGATLALLAAREIVLGKINVPATALRGVIAVGPVTVHPEDIPMKYRAAHMSYAKLGEGAPVLTRSTMVGFLQAAGIAPDDASFFPLLDEESLSKFPPVYISTAECDPLRDDGRALVAAFRDAGVNVHEDLYEGLPHAFWFFNGLPQWQGFVRNIVAAIQWITVQKHLVDSD